MCEYGDANRTGLPGLWRDRETRRSRSPSLLVARTRRARGDPGRRPGLAPRPRTVPAGACCPGQAASASRADRQCCLTRRRVLVRANTDSVRLPITTIARSSGGGDKEACGRSIRSESASNTGRYAATDESAVDPDDRSSSPLFSSRYTSGPQVSAPPLEYSRRPRRRLVHRSHRRLRSRPAPRRPPTPGCSPRPAPAASRTAASAATSASAPPTSRTGSRPPRSSRRAAPSAADHLRWGHGSGHAADRRFCPELRKSEVTSAHLTCVQTALQSQKALQMSDFNDFKTGRASQPGAWKVRFLRRFVAGSDIQAPGRPPGPAQAGPAWSERAPPPSGPFTARIAPACATQPRRPRLRRGPFG